MLNFVFIMYITIIIIILIKLINRGNGLGDNEGKLIADSI